MMSLSRARSVLAGAVVAAGAMAFAVVGAPSAHATGIAAVTDPDFAACLQGDLTAQGVTDLESLTGYISCEGDQNWAGPAYGISSLAGAEHLTGISSLDVSFNLITDVSPLAGLTNLNMLNLSFNQIADISSLAALPAVDGETGHVFTAARQLPVFASTGAGTYPSPVVSLPDRPVTMTVISGPATIDAVNGTITYSAPGTVKLMWTPPNGDIEGFFTGSGTVTVTDASTPPSSEPPSSEPPSSAPPSSEPPSVPASSSVLVSSEPPSVPVSLSAAPPASGSGASGLIGDTGGSLQSPSPVAAGLVIGLAMIVAGLILPIAVRRRPHTSHQA